jgi:hypothetical protein
VQPPPNLATAFMGLTLTDKGHPTLVPAAVFNAERDAEVLRKAMKGVGTDEGAIVSVVGYRSSAQLNQVMLMFKTMYGKDLIKDLESELSGQFLRLVKSRFKLPARLDAWAMHKAMAGAGTDEECLIEVLCSRNNAQIAALKTEYKAVYGKELEDAILSETSGHFKRLLVSLLQANRDETTNVDAALAESEAKALHEAGEKKWGTDESRFNQVLAVRNVRQLCATFDAYARLSKYDIERSIEREMSGDLRAGMLAVVQCIRARENFFANRLFKSMKGAGTNDRTLVRIVASRCEVDMVEIKAAFMRLHHKSLGLMIEGDTSGHYKKLLLTLIAETPSS